MGGAYPELLEHAESTDMWLAREEEGFGRTLAQGMSTLREHIEQARAAGAATVPAAEVFRLHDTFGFPYEMTSELLARGGPRDRGRLRGPDGGAARARARRRARGAGAAARGALSREQASAFAGEAAADALHRL